MTSLPDEVFQPQCQGGVVLQESCKYCRLQFGNIYHNMANMSIDQYGTIWHNMVNMAKSFRHLAKGTLAGELLVERLKVAGGLLLQVGVVNLQTISLPNGILLPKHLAS